MNDQQVFKELEARFENQREKVEQDLIKDIQSCLFNEISYDIFLKTLKLKDKEFRRKFEDACLLIIESSNIQTKYKCIRTLLLIIAVETLMMDEKHCDFKDWLIAIKGIKGISERNKLLIEIDIKSHSQLKEFISKMYEVYIKYYGITNKLRHFFLTYLDIDSKKKLIKSFSFKKEEINKYVHKCFISKEECFSNPNYDRCYESNGCKLKDPDEVDKILETLVPIIYGYFRSNFVHSGIQGHTADDVSCVYDIYKGKDILVELSYDTLKDIIVKGIKNYYYINIHKS